MYGCLCCLCDWWVVWNVNMGVATFTLHAFNASEFKLINCRWSLGPFMIGGLLHLCLALQLLQLILLIKLCSYVFCPISHFQVLITIMENYSCTSKIITSIMIMHNFLNYWNAWLSLVLKLLYIFCCKFST